MPKILERLVRQLRAKGYNVQASRKIAVKALQRSGNLKKGSTEPTKKGIKRGNMTPGERAKDRESKYSKGKHKPKDYKYHKKSNTATLKK